MALRELLAKFDIDTGKSEQKLGQLASGLDKVAGTLGALADAFVGSSVVHGLGEFIKGQIEAGSRVNDLSERLGVGVEELQAFQFAAGLAGVGSEEAAKGLQFLNKNIGEAITGNEEAAKTFAGLGIALKDGNGEVRETSDILPEVADKFAEMGSDAERTAMAMKIFGKAGAGLIPLLKNGGDGLEEMRKKFEDLGGGMSKEFITAADEAGDEIDTLKFGLNNFKSQIAFAILPVVTKVAKQFQDWTAKLIRLEKTTHLAKATWAVFGAGSAAASLKAASGFAKLLGVVPKDAGFWKTALGLGEIGLAIAAVAALGLVLEDLWVGMNGGDSLTREWLTDLLGAEKANEFFDLLKTTVDEITKAFKDMGPELRPLLDDLLKMGKDAGPGIAKAFVWVVKAVVGATRVLAGFAQIVAKTISAVDKFVKGDNSGVDKLGSDILDISTKAGDAVFGRGGLFDMAPSNNIGDYGVASRYIAAPQGVPFGPPPPPAKVDQRNTVHVTVQGGNNPKETGAAVSDGVRDAMNPQLDRAMGAALSGG